MASALWQSPFARSGPNAHQVLHESVECVFSKAVQLGWLINKPGSRGDQEVVTEFLLDTVRNLNKRGPGLASPDRQQLRRLSTKGLQE